MNAGPHFHRCHNCGEDELCRDVMCGTYEDDDLVTRGGAAHCSNEWCQSVKNQEEAMERLGGKAA